jgi:hypothetical protein
MLYISYSLTQCLLTLSLYREIERPCLSLSTAAAAAAAAVAITAALY